MATLAAVVLYAVENGGDHARLAAAPGGIAILLLALAVVLRWPSFVPWAMLVAGGAYLVGREGRSVVDGWASLVGVALLLSAELASWSIEHDARIKTQRSLVLRRALTLGALIAAAVVLDFVLLGTAAISASAGVLLAAAGVAAAVSSVAIVLRLIRA